MLDLVAGWETICYNNIFANDIFANSLNLCGEIKTS